MILKKASRKVLELFDLTDATPAQQLIYGSKSYTLNYLQAGQSSHVCRRGKTLTKLNEELSRTDDRRRKEAQMTEEGKWNPTAVKVQNKTKLCAGCCTESWVKRAEKPVQSQMKHSEVKP